VSQLINFAQFRPKQQLPRRLLEKYKTLYVDARARLPLLTCRR
jgi:hypothetical protein